MQHEITIILKSGREINFVCDEYTLTESNITGDLIACEFKNASGEAPIYLKLSDIEIIIAKKQEVIK